MFHIGRHFLTTTWPRNWLRLRLGQPFLDLKVHRSSVPFSAPFPQPQNLFLETAKLLPKIWFNTNGRLKQFSVQTATQMSASATSQITVIMRNQFRLTIKHSSAQLNKSFGHFSAFISTQKLTERIKIKAWMKLQLTARSWLAIASMIALHVVRTSFGFHLRECMGSCFPPL